MKMMWPAGDGHTAVKTPLGLTITFRVLLRKYVFMLLLRSFPGNTLYLFFGELWVAGMPVVVDHMKIKSINLGIFAFIHSQGLLAVAGLFCCFLSSPNREVKVCRRWDDNRSRTERKRSEHNKIRQQLQDTKGSLRKSLEERRGMAAVVGNVVKLFICNKRWKKIF